MQDPYVNVVKLTEREHKVLELLCRGVGPKEISTRIKGEGNLKSAHYYISRAKWKLGARTAYQAAAIFGMLHPEVIKQGTYPEVNGRAYHVPKAWLTTPE